MSIVKNISQSGIIKRGVGKLLGLIINSHSSGTLKVIDGEEAGVAASGVLTSAGACAPASHATSEIVSSGAMVEATHAVSVLTGNAIVATNIVVIGTKTYTFVDSLTANVANEVLVGATLTISLSNLKAAINLEDGAGTLYGMGTVVNTQVVAVASDGTTVTVRGRVPGTSLNAVATTGTTSRTVWADTTLGGGTGASNPGVATTAAKLTIGAIVYTIVDALSESYGADAIAYQVKKGANEAAMLDNLKAAINASGTAGTEYSTGILAHADIIATTNTNTVQTILARVPGTTPNSIATTEAMANTAWADTTLGGGTGNSNPGVTTAAATIIIGSRTYTAVDALSETSGADAIVDQILWVTSEAVFLDNLKKAINASGVAGTDYSTGTLENYDVVATTNTNTAQTIVYKKLGTGGNALATTETLANYSWAAVTLESGTGTEGKLMFNTITFSVVATTGERFIPLYDAEFKDGLYLVIGGAADVTLLIE